MAMANRGVTPMDVVFSFDTTGSMSQALDEVKARVMDIIQKLQADIPGVRVGIIAHGDYCDAEHFYDLRFLDLSDVVADVVTFVNDTEGTGGGDVPECYELALRRAKNMAWRTVGRRILVMIGDAYPHEADYPLNVQNIDWKTELADLVAMNVHIYGVQVQNDELSTQFFNTLATSSEGQHLQLANMGRICEVIMGICYREQGPIMFQNYEAEMRHKEPEKFGPDLECVFGTLRHEVSRTSDVTAILDQGLNDINMDDLDGDDDADYDYDQDVSRRRFRRNSKPRLKRLRLSDPNSTASNTSDDDDGDEDDDDDIMGNGKLKLKHLRFSQVFPDDENTDDTDDDIVRGNRRPNLKRLRTVDLDNKDEADQTPTKKRKTMAAGGDSLSPAPKQARKIVTASRKVAKQTPKVKAAAKVACITRSRSGGSRAASTNPRKLYRERVPFCHFQSESASFSPWHLAVCPKSDDRLISRVDGKWKSLGGDNTPMWRKNLLDDIPATRGCAVMFELAVQAPSMNRKKVVCYHITKGVRGRGVLGLPWYRGVFRNVRDLVNGAASQDCKLFLRWTRVKTRNLKKCHKAVQQYNYAWKAQPPRLCF